jgi:serine acetyltransferase
MLGAMALATKPVPPASVSVGIPAKVKRHKDVASPAGSGRV